FRVAAINAVAQDRKRTAEALLPRSALRAMIAEDHRHEQDALPCSYVAHIFADFCDLSGNIAAVDVRQLYSWQPFAHPQIQVIQRAGTHANQHLIFAKLRVRHILVAQDLRPAKLVEADCFHVFSTRCFDSRRCARSGFRLRAPGAACLAAVVQSRRTRRSEWLSCAAPVERKATRQSSTLTHGGWLARRPRGSPQ